LPPAIFWQPVRLNRNNNQGSREGSCVIGARNLNVSMGLGRMTFDYGRWPKGNGTKPMSWGVALVITHENGVFEMDLRSGDTGND
jgi:hypothetical protein